jgi:chitodextrinase
MAAAAAVAACMSAGCGLTKQDRPASAGPSEFGQSISVSATPDRISQDGQSQTIAQAIIRDANGKAMPGVTVQWTVVAWRDSNENNLHDGSEQTFGVLVEPSSQQSITDGAGIARVSVAAPPPPAVLPTDFGKLRISVEVVNGDVAATLNSRSAVVLLVPPPGTLPQNRVPIAAFSIVPAIGIINQSLTFDASTTTDEGEPCGDACTYQWDFGDFEHGSGKVVNHTYWRPATFTVTLTVTDSRGGVGSTQRSLTITGPAAPVAALSITPATVTLTSGGSVVMNASASTIGAGGIIEEYAWDFGDGNTTTTTVPIVSHQYTSTGVKAVIVTIKDNFGRTAVAGGSVTVNP